MILIKSNTTNHINIKKNVGKIPSTVNVFFSVFDNEINNILITY